MDSPEASGTDLELRTDWDHMHSALDIDSMARMNEALGSSMARRMLHGAVLGELEEQRSLEEELRGT
jgi:hypothetical protein